MGKFGVKVNCEPAENTWVCDKDITAVTMTWQAIKLLRPGDLHFFRRHLTTKSGTCKLCCK